MHQSRRSPYEVYLRRWEAGETDCLLTLQPFHARCRMVPPGWVYPAKRLRYKLLESQDIDLVINMGMGAYQLCKMMRPDL